MGKRLHVILDDWIYDDIVEDRPKGVTRTARVRELLIKGHQAIKEGNNGAIASR